MSKFRFLTKSRFKLGIECPTKLFYTRKKEYLDKKLEDSFLEALAEGGYQVGELAKKYYPGGHDITSLNYEVAEEQTLRLLKEDKVVIFEPAIKFKNLFIRIDVLVKNGNSFELIEVKAKSFDKEVEDPFQNKNGSISSEWKPYLYDIAFQKYVLSQAYPEANIASYLMMADKNAKCPVDGLNQKFQIVRDESNRKGIKVSSNLVDSDLQDKILIKVPVDEYIEQIYEGTDTVEGFDDSFVERVQFLSQKYENDEKVRPEIGSKCAKCEFNCSPTEEGNGSKSGFKECWGEALGWKEKDFDEPNVLSIWNFRRKDKLISQGALKLRDLTEEDISPKPDKKKDGLSTSERQWLQVEKIQNKDNTPYLDVEGLNYEMSQWKFPLHFIDFETTAVAIPFNKGRKPYEGVAFQFSHHIVTKDGSIEHKGQYLNANPGEFPNYQFIRELKKELEKDEGTVFRYAAHENTYLNLIYRQLMEDETEISDRDELCAFIKTITKSVKNSVEKWEGERNMVDMLELVKRYYYDPFTNGSNSIKYVLPAILNSSKYLQEKYAKPIYGSSNGIKSLNFKDWQWIKFDGEQVVDPYKQLPKMFQDASEHDLDILTADDELRNGGAALTAYGRLQFTEMTDYERNELEQALLKYCELDTLAMVMIYEGWREMLESKVQLHEEAV